MGSPTARRRLAAALFFVAILAAVELLSRGGLAVLERRGVAYRPLVADRLSTRHRELLENLLAGRPSLFAHDAVLGWTLRPGFRSALCTVDRDGLRRDPERPEPDAGAVRVATFGDSFTFGGDVADRDAYPEVLARLDARLAIDNFAVPAYGLDQAFLRYQQEGRGREPQVVILGFMAENILRDVSVFRPFYRAPTELPLAKPRFRLEPGPAGEPELTLLANPLPRLEDYRQLLARPAETLARLGRNDFFYRTRSRAGACDASATVRLAKLAREELLPESGMLRPDNYDPGSEAFRVTTALFSAFYEMVLRDGAQPVILIFPERGDLDRFRAKHTRRYEPLLQFLAARGYRVVDALTVLAAAADEHPASDLLPAHLSPLGNQLVAEHLLVQLRSFGLVPVQVGRTRQEPLQGAAADP